MRSRDATFALIGEDDVDRVLPFGDDEESAVRGLENFLDLAGICVSLFRIAGLCPPEYTLLKSNCEGSTELSLSS